MTTEYKSHESEEESKEDFRWTTERDQDLYKFYMETVLKAAGFIFGVTGFMVAYILKSPDPLSGGALLLPLVINLGFAVVCGINISSASTLAKRHSAHADDTRRTWVFWDLHPLVHLLRLFCIIYTLVALGLFALMMRFLCLGA